MKKKIYFDNAATSWPKPEVMAKGMMHFINEIGANPGRSGHRMSVEAGRIICEVREKIAQLLDFCDPMRIAFSHNATESLNLAIFGLIKPGDRVVISSMEHNSVTRPLRYLEQNGVGLDVVQADLTGFVDPDDVKKAICRETKLVIINHASNVVGTIQNIEAIGKIVREYDKLFMIDSTQSLGAIPIKMDKSTCIDLLAFTGHKSLYGPTGTGGLVIGQRVDTRELRPLKRGGTGSKSICEIQPEFLPDKYESGTPNIAGIAGLNESLSWLMDYGIQNVRNKEAGLMKRLFAGLDEIEGVTVYGPKDPARQVAVTSFNISGLYSSEVGMVLDEDYGILTRVGLQCSPPSHQTIGTFPNGTVRFGLGMFNTEEEVDYSLNAIREIWEKNR